MNLFNEYENKNLQFIVNYINQISSGNLNPLTQAELFTLLSGDKLKLSSAEIVNALLNLNEMPSDNSNILFKDSSDEMLPIISLPDCGHLPILTSYAEKSWLYYILQDPKADLFLNPGVKQAILSALSDGKLVDIKKHVHTISFQRSVFSEQYIQVFRRISYLLKNHMYAEIICDSQSFDVLPLKIRYHQPSDSFSVLAQPANTDNLISIDISSITLVEKSSLGKFNADNIDFNNHISDILNKHLAKEPILVEINTSNPMGDNNQSGDRFSHLFASFDTTTYEDESFHLISSIKYYNFQYYEVLDKILSLGKYIKVLAPESIKKEVQGIVCARTSLYETN